MPSLKERRDRINSKSQTGDLGSVRDLIARCTPRPPATERFAFFV